jgi:hypothetical protein
MKRMLNLRFGEKMNKSHLHVVSDIDQDDDSTTNNSVVKFLKENADIMGFVVVTSTMLVSVAAILS